MHSDSSTVNGAAGAKGGQAMKGTATGAKHATVALRNAVGGKGTKGTAADAANAAEVATFAKTSLGGGATARSRGASLQTCEGGSAGAERSRVRENAGATHQAEHGSDRVNALVSATGAGRNAKMDKTAAGAKGATVGVMNAVGGVKGALGGKNAPGVKDAPGARRPKNFGGARGAGGSSGAAGANGPQTGSPLPGGSATPGACEPKCACNPGSANGGKPPKRVVKPTLTLTPNPELVAIAKEHFANTRHGNITSWLNKALLRELRKDAGKIRAAGIEIPEWLFLK
jgi:hypothetical protein